MWRLSVAACRDRPGTAGQPAAGTAAVQQVGDIDGSAGVHACGLRRRPAAGRSVLTVNERVPGEPFEAAPLHRSLRWGGVGWEAGGVVPLFNGVGPG